MRFCFSVVLTPQIMPYGQAATPLAVYMQPASQTSVSLSGLTVADGTALVAVLTVASAVQGLTSQVYITLPFSFDATPPTTTGVPIVDLSATLSTYALPVTTFNPPSLVATLAQLFNEVSALVPAVQSVDQIDAAWPGVFADAQSGVVDFFACIGACCFVE